MDDAAKVEVYDMVGRLVFSAKENLQSVTTNLSAGMYVVKIVASNGNTTFERVIIK